MSARQPVQDSQAPQVGFIGWSAECAALLETLAVRHAGLGERACWFPVGAPVAAPPEMRAAPTMEALFTGSDLLVVGAPQAVVEPLLPMMRLSISDRHRVVLLGLGWSLDAVLHQFKERKLVRCLVLPFGRPGAPLVAYYATEFLTPADAAGFRALFGHLELVLQLDSEAQFEAVLGLAGFTPATLYTLVDAMADGALMAGLARPVALKCIASLMLGAAGQLLEDGAHPALLREETLRYPVAAAGLMEMESAGIRGLMMRALGKGIRAITPVKPTLSTKEEE